MVFLPFFAIFLDFLDRSAVEAHVIRSMNVRAGGGGSAPFLICVPSAEHLFGGWFYATGVQVVINHLRWIDEKSKPRDWSESRVIQINDKQRE